VNIPAVSAGISGIPAPVPEFRPDLTTKHFQSFPLIRKDIGGAKFQK
jgi:hypothetical protein